MSRMIRTRSNVLVQRLKHPRLQRLVALRRGACLNLGPQEPGLWKLMSLKGRAPTFGVMTYLKSHLFGPPRKFSLFLRHGQLLPATNRSSESGPGGQQAKL